MKEKTLTLTGLSLCVIIFIGILLSSSSLRKPQPLITVARLVSVYDGDTFKVNLDCDMPVFCDEISVRILGIDTPEIRGSKCPYENTKAKQAKAVLSKLLKEGHHIELKNVDRGKYFRILADVYVDGENVALYMMEKGLAVEYDGGTKIDWCFEKGD